MSLVPLPTQMPKQIHKNLEDKHCVFWKDTDTLIK